MNIKSENKLNSNINKTKLITNDEWEIDNSLNFKQLHVKYLTEAKNKINTRRKCI